MSDQGERGFQQRLNREHQEEMTRTMNMIVDAMCDKTIRHIRDGGHPRAIRKRMKIELAEGLANQQQPQQPQPAEQVVPPPPKRKPDQVVPQQPGKPLTDGIMDCDDDDSDDNLPIAEAYTRRQQEAPRPANTTRPAKATVVDEQQTMTMEEFAKLWMKDVIEIYKSLNHANGDVQVARDQLEKYMPKMEIRGYQLFSGPSHQSLFKRMMHAIKAQPTLEAMYACALQSMDHEVSLNVSPTDYHTREEEIRVALLSLMEQCTAACGDEITSSMPPEAARIIQALFKQNEHVIVRRLDAYFCDGTSNWEEPVEVGLPEYTASALYAKNKRYPGFFESHTNRYKCQNPCRRLSSDGFGIPAAIFALLLGCLTLVEGDLILSINETDQYNLNEMLQSNPLVLYHILHVLTMSMHIGWHSVLSLLEKNGVAPHYDHYDGGFTRENPPKFPQHVISNVQSPLQLTRVPCHKDTGRPVSYDDWMDFVEWLRKMQNEHGYPRLETQDGTGKINVDEALFLKCLEDHGQFTFGPPNCEGFVEGEDNVIVLNLIGMIHAGPLKFKQPTNGTLYVRVLFCPSGMFVHKVPEVTQKMTKKGEKRKRN